MALPGPPPPGGAADADGLQSRKFSRKSQGPWLPTFRFTSRSDRHEAPADTDDLARAPSRTARPPPQCPAPPPRPSASPSSPPPPSSRPRGETLKNRRPRFLLLLAAPAAPPQPRAAPALARRVLTPEPHLIHSALASEVQLDAHRGLLATAPAMPPAAMTKKPPTPPGEFDKEDYNGKKPSGLCCENFSGNVNACNASKLGCKFKNKTGKCVRTRRGMQRTPRATDANRPPNRLSRRASPSVASSGRSCATAATARAPPRASPPGRRTVRPFPPFPGRGR